jgi:hypothetical protein
MALSTEGERPYVVTLLPTEVSENLIVTPGEDRCEKKSPHRMRASEGVTHDTQRTRVLVGALTVEFYGKEINAFTAGDGSCDPHSAANQL